MSSLVRGGAGAGDWCVCGAVGVDPAAMASPPPAKALAFDAFGDEGELEEVNGQKPTTKMSLKMPARLQQQLESRQQQLARREERRQNNDETTASSPRGGGVGRPRSGRPSRYVRCHARLLPLSLAFPARSQRVCRSLIPQIQSIGITSFDAHQGSLVSAAEAPPRCRETILLTRIAWRWMSCLVQRLRPASPHGQSAAAIIIIVTSAAVPAKCTTHAAASPHQPIQPPTGQPAPPPAHPRSTS